MRLLAVFLSVMWNNGRSHKLIFKGIIVFLSVFFLFLGAIRV